MSNEQLDNIYVKADEAEKLGVRVRDGIKSEEEWAAFDKLPPLLRQHLNESPFEWAAITVLQALDLACASQPWRTREQHANDVVIFLHGEDERALAILRAEREATTAKP